MIKKEIRVLGIATVFVRARNGDAIQVIGVVYRGNRWLEGVMRAVIPRKLSNLTTRIAKMATKSPHFPQLRAIVLDELISRQGSYIEIKALSKMTELPVVAVLREKLETRRLSKIRTTSRRAIGALTTLPCQKWRAAGNTYLVYSAGLGELSLDELLEVCASREGMPEPARVARIMASSLQKFLAGGVP